jgi:hypothetical protein
MILATIAFAAISATGAMAKEDRKINAFDEEVWSRQFDGANDKGYDYSMFEGIEANAISPEELTRRADKANLDYIDKDFFEAFANSKEIGDAVGRDFQLGLVKAMKANPAMGSQSHKLEDLLGEGIEGGQKPNMADTMERLNKDWTHLEEDMEIYMSAIEADVREFDATSADILDRLIKGDLTEFDAAMEQVRRETDAIDTVELKATFDRSNKEMEETDVLEEAYDKLLNTPEVNKLGLKNAAIGEMLKNKKNFAKYTKASNKLFEEATFSALKRDN